MKYEKQLLYNSVAEWKDHYIDYTHLKKFLGTLKKTQNALDYGEDEETESRQDANSKQKKDKDSSDDEKSKDNMPAKTGGGDTTAGASDNQDKKKEKPVDDEDDDEEDDYDRRGKKKNLRKLDSSKIISEQLLHSASATALSQMDQEDSFYTTEHEMLLSTAHHHDRIAPSAAVLSHGLQPKTSYGTVTIAAFGSLSHRAAAMASQRKLVTPATVGTAITFDMLDAQFFQRLEKEAKKVQKFYIKMVGALEDITTELEKEGDRIMSDTKQKHYESLKHALRERYIEHLIEIVELKTFAELNREGFRKIVKKHDKLLRTETIKDFLNKLDINYSFATHTAIEEQRQRNITKFAGFFWKGDVSLAEEELSQQLHDLVIYERNTVWRDMLLSERRVHGMVGKSMEKGMKKDSFPHGGNMKLLLFAILIAGGIFMFPEILDSLIIKHGGLTDDAKVAAHHCLVLLVFVSMLWCTEAVPLYVTSILVVPLSVILQVFLDDTGTSMTPQVAAPYAISRMGAPIILLIIGGYSLSAALSKYAIDKYVATSVLNRFRHPAVVLFVLMNLALFLSMWVSNVATPVLLNSVILPMIRGMPNSALPLVKSLLLGIAFASNIGGMTTPIASPQNAVALGQLKGMHDISFLEWMGVAVPQCMIMILICQLLLVAWFRPQAYAPPIIPKHADKFTIESYIILLTMAATIFLWCFKPAYTIFGNEGLVATLPVVVFFGTGILNKEDFNNLPWNVIYLVAGGVVLGAAVQSSQLLAIVANALHHHLANASLWQVYAVFCIFIFTVSSMVSHTVAAIIVLPIVAEVGASLGHPRLLVMGATMACSGAMALPISSFPNMAAISVDNETGKPYVVMTDIIALGVPMTLGAGAVVLSVGYVMMYFLRF